MREGGIWTWRRPIVLPSYSSLEAEGWRHCSCGHMHSPGTKTIQRHRHRLIGPEVFSIYFGWPVGRVTFRRVERA